MASGGPTSFEHPELEGRILARLQAGGVKEELIDLLKMRFASAMSGEIAVISRPKRKQLFARVGEIVLGWTIDELKSRR